MFFDDPVAAMRNIGQSLRGGGRVAFICWQARDRNPWMGIPMAAALEHVPPPPPLPPDAPGPWAFADPDRVTTILTSAGFAEVVIEPFEHELLVGGASTLDDAVAFAIDSGSVRGVLGDVASTTRAGVRVDQSRVRAVRRWRRGAPRVGRVGRARQVDDVRSTVTETSFHRRQRAMGALVGAIVGDALAAPFEGEPGGAYTRRFPRPVLTGHGEMVGEGRWGAHTEMALLVAHSLLGRDGLDEEDLVARGLGGDPVTRTVPAAIAFAHRGKACTTEAAERLCRMTTDAPRVVAACVALHLALADALNGDTDLTTFGNASSFSEAVVREIDVGGDVRATGSITGALAGAHWGIGAIPARWASPLHGDDPDGDAGGRDIVALRALAVRLADLDPENNVEEPEWPARGPHLVDPRGLWVADLNGAARSHEVVPGAHVVSLSRAGDRPRQPHWRRFYLVDSEDPRENIALDAVLEDVVGTVTACIDAGEPVVVHCYAGESRTGLVLARVAHAARWLDRTGGDGRGTRAVAAPEDVELGVHRSAPTPGAVRHGALRVRRFGWRSGTTSNPGRREARSTTKRSECSPRSDG